MKKNMGNVDRIIRVLIAAIVIYLYVQGIISGTLGIVLIVFSGIFLLTSLISVCPLYMPFSISTCKVKKQDS